MTKPILHHPQPGLLDRDESVAFSRSTIDLWSPYLEELLNLGSNLLAEFQGCLHGLSGTPLSLIYLYYHVLQIADGIHALCHNACFSSADPMLRSLFEGVLSIEYMLESDFENRSTAWLACGYYNQIRYWELQDPDLGRGQRVAELKETDKFMRGYSLGEDDVNKVRKQIGLYRSMLLKPKFVEVIAKLKEKDLKQGRWHSVNGGCATLRDVAEHLRRPMEYVFLYSAQSTMSHAKDVSRYLTLADGKIVFVPLRHSNSPEYVYSYTTCRVSEATWLVADKLLPDRNIRALLKEVLLRHRPEAADFE